MEVRTRIAPSPTGKLHLGTAYAALWPYIFARKHNGKFVLRIEDTDRDRSTQEYAENIIQGLKWLRFHWDEGPFYQMDRLDLYKRIAERLLKERKAYYCFCTREQLEAVRKEQAVAGLPQVYSGRCRNLDPEDVKKRLDQGQSYVVRFKMPEDRGEISWKDMIHGEIKFEAKLIGDFVIMRQNQIPLYNFAVVVDDMDMKITHVLRGDDHISNTPKQIVLFEALEVDHPEYGHYPMVLNPDRMGKLSKRTGSTALDDYIKDGYLPEAIVNYLMLLGWTPPIDQEILPLEKMIELFDVKDMNKAPAAWNPAKLDWINGEYIRMLSDEELTRRLQEYLVDHPARDRIAPIVPLIKERIKKLSDFIPLTFFFFEEPEYNLTVFEKLKISDPRRALQELIPKLESLEKPWDAEKFEQTVRFFAKQQNIPDREAFQLIRVSLTGQLVSPPLFESIQVLGEEKALERIRNVVERYTQFSSSDQELTSEATP